MNYFSTITTAIKVRFILLLCVLAIAFPINATAQSSLRAETMTSLTRLVHDWADDHHIPSVILQVKLPDEKPYSLAAGYRTLANKKAITPNAHFRAASVGKLFTAVATLRLMEKGLLNLDNPIGMYLNDGITDRLHHLGSQNFGPSITIRQLLAHTSGLPDIDDDEAKDNWLQKSPRKKKRPDELIEFAIRQGPKFEPGKGQLYSSAGYMVLGLVLESATGKPYHTIIRDEVLSPLGLEDTFEEANELPEKLTLAHSYVGSYDMNQIHPSMEFADGGFVSTTADLVRFGEALARGEVFSSKHTLEIMMKPLGEESIGLGTFLGTTEDGHHFFFHPGYWGVMLFVIPDEEVAIAFTLNQSEANSEMFLEEIFRIIARQ